MNILNSNRAGTYFAAGLLGTINAPAEPTRSNKGSDASETAKRDAATDVTLSAEARKRLQDDRAAAEKLAEAISEQEIPQPEDRGNDIAFGDLFEMAERNRPPRKQQSEDGLLRALPREQMMAMKKEMTENFWAGAVERRNPEQAEALRKALSDGSARIRLASDVPGTNKRTSVEYLQNGQGMRTSSTGTPSPEIQAEIDAGRALLTWKHGVGDLYITW